MDARKWLNIWIWTPILIVGRIRTAIVTIIWLVGTMGVYYTLSPQEVGLLIVNLTVLLCLAIFGTEVVMLFLRGQRHRWRAIRMLHRQRSSMVKAVPLQTVILSLWGELPKTHDEQTNRDSLQRKLKLAIDEGHIKAVGKLNPEDGKANVGTEVDVDSMINYLRSRHELNDFFQ